MKKKKHLKKRKQNYSWITLLKTAIFALPVVLYISVVCFIVPTPNSGFIVIGGIGTVFLGVSLVSFAGKINDMYFGHIITFGLLGVGAVLLFPSVIVLYTPSLYAKFDEQYGPVFLGNPQYEKLAAKFAEITVKSGCVIEVNTGAISRGYRKTPYPHEKLLHIIKKEGGRLILNSDSHNINTLDFHFTEARQLLKDVGINEIYHFVDSNFVKENI